VLVDDVMTDGATKREAVDLLRRLVDGVRIPALVVAVDREEVGADGHTSSMVSFTEDTGVPVHPAVRMTELLDYLRERGSLEADDFARCLDYLAQYGTTAAREWVAARRAS
jgi:orotate phosphoribosyltransferase